MLGLSPVDVANCVPTVSKLEEKTGGGWVSFVLLNRFLFFQRLNVIQVTFHAPVPAELTFSCRELHLNADNQ